MRLFRVGGRMDEGAGSGWAQAGERDGNSCTGSIAADVGIAPGIIVGRLQHERFISWSSLNHLKAKAVLPSD